MQTDSDEYVVVYRFESEQKMQVAVSCLHGNEGGRVVAYDSQERKVLVLHKHARCAERLFSSAKLRFEEKQLIAA